MEQYIFGEMERICCGSTFLDVIFLDIDLHLHQLPKLTIEHIHLTSYAKKKVNLAVQILSISMAEALRRRMPLEVVSETQPSVS